MSRGARPRTPAAAESNAIDIVITDILMPQMDVRIYPQMMQNGRRCQSFAIRESRLPELSKLALAYGAKAALSKR